MGIAGAFESSYRRCLDRVIVGQIGDPIADAAVAVPDIGRPGSGVAPGAQGVDVNAEKGAGLTRRHQGFNGAGGGRFAAGFLHVGRPVVVDDQNPIVTTVSSRSLSAFIDVKPRQFTGENRVSNLR